VCPQRSLDGLDVGPAQHEAVSTEGLAHDRLPAGAAMRGRSRTAARYPPAWRARSGGALGSPRAGATRPSGIADEPGAEHRITACVGAGEIFIGETELEEPEELVEP